MNIGLQEGAASPPPNQQKSPLPPFSRRSVRESSSLKPQTSNVQNSNRKIHEKLENQLTRPISAASKFLIDNFCRDLRTGFTSHSPLATSHSFLAGAPFFAGLAKSEFFSISNRQVHRKLENRLTPAPSTSSKFLIDNFCRCFGTFLTSHSLALGEAEGRLAGAPFFAGLAKSEFFPISNRQVHRKLENRLTPAPSTSSKFLIDNFCRDLRTGFTGHSLALTQEGPLATSHSAGVSQ